MECLGVVITPGFLFMKGELKSSVRIESNERLSQHPQCLILSCFHNFPFSGTFIINAAQMKNSVDNHTM